MLVIIPSSMESAMQRDLDALRDSLPENERPLFEAERDVHRQEIINFYAENGYYPSIGGVTKQHKEVTTMLDNYPPGFDHSKLDGETREQSDLIDRVESMQDVYKDILQTIAAKIKEHKLVVERDTLAYFGDIVLELVSAQVERERKLLADFCIDVTPWPENDSEFINNLTKGLL